MTENHETGAVGLIVAPASLPAPVPTYTPDQMIEALTRYRALQQALDQAMPDQILTIGDRQFRKKGYWRAIAVAFQLTVEPLEEARVARGTFADGRENFGYLVTYRARAANGRVAIGDGAAFAVEKAPRFKCPHPHPTRERSAQHYPPESCPDFNPAHIWRMLPAQATEHNIRAHAHTRGYNRAISNLVGFAETPAEEVESDEPAPARSSSRRGRRTTRATSPMIDAAQQRRLFERAREAGWTDDGLKAWFSSRHGIASTSEIHADQYDELVDQLLLERPGDGGVN